MLRYIVFVALQHKAALLNNKPKTQYLIVAKEFVKKGNVDIQHFFFIFLCAHQSLPDGYYTSRHRPRQKI
jgi:hypothetical protein